RARLPGTSKCRSAGLPGAKEIARGERSTTSLRKSITANSGSTKQLLSSISMPRSGGRRTLVSVLLLQLAEQLLHALVGEVASHALDEFDHQPGAAVAMSEDLTQPGTLDDRGVELEPRMLQVVGN